jgi:hypothetical protein
MATRPEIAVRLFVVRFVVVVFVNEVSVNVPLIPPVVERSVATGLVLRRTPVVVPLAVPLVPAGQLVVVAPAGQNKWRSRFASKNVPNETVVVVLAVEEVVVPVVVVVGVVAVVPVVVVPVVPVVPSAPAPTLPTGTFNDTPGITMPFSGFGSTSATWWLVPAVSTKSASCG